MMHLKGTLQRLLTQQSGQIHLLIMAPILTLSFLSLVVRTASSAVDPALEKRKVAAQLRQRLSELRHDHEPGVPPTAGPSAPHASPGTPGQCMAGGLRGETVVSGPMCYSEPDKTRVTPPPLVLGGSGVRSFAELSRRLAEGEDPNRAEKKETRGVTVGSPFHSLVPGSIRDKLAGRVVSLTVAFEQGAISSADYFGTVAGDYDGQGFSFGALQWNLGSCSLQPLLQAFRQKDPALFSAVMETGADFIAQLIDAPCDEARVLARRVLLNEKGQVKEPWVTRFRALGRVRVFQEVQVKSLLPQVQKAYDLADEFGFRSERAVALFFDILVQNGGIPSSVRTQYEQDLQDAARFLGRTPDEVERMTILANRQAEAAHPRWIDTVRARKLTIARGEGSVNGITYDLDAVGIKLRNRRAGKAAARTPRGTARERLTPGELRG